MNTSNPYNRQTAADWTSNIEQDIKKHGYWEHPYPAIGKLRAHAVPRVWLTLSIALGFCLTFTVCSVQNVRVVVAQRRSAEAWEAVKITQQQYHEALVKQSSELRDTQQTLASCMTTLNRYHAVLNDMQQKAQAQAVQSPQANQTVAILRFLAGLL